MALSCTSRCPMHRYVLISSIAGFGLADTVNEPARKPLDQSDRERQRCFRLRLELVSNIRAPRVAGTLCGPEQSEHCHQRADTGRLAFTRQNKLPLFRLIAKMRDRLAEGWPFTARTASPYARVGSGSRP